MITAYLNQYEYYGKDRLINFPLSTPGINFAVVTVEEK